MAELFGPAGAQGSSADPQIVFLQGLCGELNRRGWAARLTVTHLYGEVDIRLEVRGDSVMTVELLGPSAGWETDACWDAVRIKPASRVLWRGPERDAGSGTMLRFLEDLLWRDVEELTGYYQRLG
jgi:hypothetical protein